MNKITKETYDGLGATEVMINEKSYPSRGVQVYLEEANEEVEKEIIEAGYTPYLIVTKEMSEEEAKKFKEEEESKIKEKQEEVNKMIRDRVLEDIATLGFTAEELKAVGTRIEEVIGVDDTNTEDLTKLSKKELIQYAKENYNVELSDKLKQTELIKAIEDLANGINTSNK